LNQAPFYAILRRPSQKQVRPNPLVNSRNLLTAPAQAGLLVIALGLSAAPDLAARGWDCIPAADGRGWDCAPAGAEPRQPAPLPPPATLAEPTPFATAPADVAVPTEPPRPPAASTEAAPPPGGAAQPAAAAVPPTPPETTAGEPEPAPETKREPEPEPEPETEREPEEATGREAREAAEPTGGPGETTPQEAPPPPATTADGSWFPDLDEGLQWENCRLPALPAVAIETPGGVLVGEADAAELPQESGIALFRGHVRLQRPGSRILADELEYDRDRRHVTAPGALFIEQPKMKVTAARGDYYPEEARGTLEEVDYRLLEPRARGESDRVELLDRQHSRFEQVTFTTCPPGNSGFEVRADEMEVDRNTRVAYFRNAWVDFLGAPIFYSPRLSIPLTDERRSGFLTPTFGFSSTNGFDLTVPYYFNLAPNYDATLMPRIVSERGLLVGGEFRFLYPPHNGVIRAEILPSDRKYDGNEPRGAFHAQTYSKLAPGLGASVDLNWVSDKSYLRDLGQSLAVASTSFLRNRVALDYHRRDWDLLAEVRHYRTLDEAISAQSRPYSLLPRLNLEWHASGGPLPAEYGFTGEFVHFYREDSVTGQRIDMQPQASLPLQRAWGYLEPALALRYTSYNLQDQQPGYSDTPDRFTYTLSLDGGLYFDRPTRLLGTDTTLTLEPRAFYAYTPYRNQDELPLFDTGLLDFTFDNLFRGNRFNGPDRVGDTNQLALALTSRILHDGDGRELLRASIGQIFYFRDRRVRLDPATTPADESSSSIIAEVTTELFRNWLLRAGVQVDPHNSGRKLRQGLAQATWHGEGNRRFHVAWRLREELLEQTDIAAVWPVSEKLGLIGRWYYSVQESRTVEAVGGLEYGDCCWRFRTVLRRFLEGPGDTYNNSILLELELKGLGTLGHDIDKFLDRTIYGY